MEQNQTRIAYCKKRIAVAEKMIHEAPTEKGRDAYKKVLMEENKELKYLESIQSKNQKP